MHLDAAEQPLVSIIIPTRDRPKLLKRAVRSALLQSCGDLEVVVVDDGSEPALTLHMEDDRVRILRLERSRGVCGARNAGAREARGRWITFLDDDDEMCPDMVSSSLEAAARSTLPAPVAVLSGLERVTIEGLVSSRCMPRSSPRGTDEFLRYRQETSIIGNSLFVPASTFELIGGWDEAIPMHDELFFRLNDLCSIQALPLVNYRMMDHETVRMTSSELRMAEWLLATERKHRPRFAGFKKEQSAMLHVAALGLLRGGRWGRSVITMVRSLVKDPRRPGGFAHLLQCAAGPVSLFLFRRTRAVFRRGLASQQD